MEWAQPRMERIKPMSKKRVAMIVVGILLMVGANLLLATSKWVQHYTFLHILLFSVGVGILVYGLIPSWWR